MKQSFARVSRKEIFAQTGLQFMEINTLYQMIAMQLGDPSAQSGEQLPVDARLLLATRG
ncbi:MAG: hypothetical protein R3C01_00685 [Planctomycetaceae bacterium]